MLSKQKKIKMVAEVSSAVKNSQSLILTDFSGLTMGELNSIRRELRKQEAGYKVIKKSLVGFSLAGSGAAGLDLSNHKGSVAIAYSREDGSVMAKTINGFVTSTKKLNILGGFLMGAIVDAKTVTAVAKLPSREVLLTQVVQLLMSPISGLARVLDGISKKGRE